MKIENLNEHEDDFLPLSNFLEHINKKKRHSYRRPLLTSNTIDLQVYSFDSLELMREASVRIKDVFCGKSSVYKSLENSDYLLLFERGLSDEESFDKACTVMLEYSTNIKTNYATTSILEEHYEKFINNDAINILANL